MLNEQTIVKWDKNAETDLRNGLTKAQVKERQTIYGPNRLREGKKKSVLKLFWEQLNDPLIYIVIPWRSRGIHDYCSGNYPECSCRGNPGGKGNKGN